MHLLHAEMPLLRKFPEIMKFEMLFRKFVTILCEVARPYTAEIFEVQEMSNFPGGISVHDSTGFSLPSIDPNHPPGCAEYCHCEHGCGKLLTSNPS